MLWRESRCSRTSSMPCANSRRSVSAWSTAMAARRCAPPSPGATAQARSIWVLQEPQLGTGHAVMQALPHLDERVPTLVLYGDVPLIRAATLKRLCAAAGAGMAVLTAELDDPHGLRAHRARSRRAIVRIVEEKDANPAEQAIREVNTGIMVAPTTTLKSWLARLSNDNVQREYYLTDIVALAVADGVAVSTRATACGLGDPGRQQPQPARGAGARSSSHRRRRADGPRRDARRSGAHRRARAARLRARRGDRRQLRLRRRGHAGRPRQHRCQLRAQERARCRRDRASSRSATSRTRDIGARLPHRSLRAHPPGHRARRGRAHRQLRRGQGEQHRAKAPRRTTWPTSATPKSGRNVNVGAGTITCNYDGANKHRTVIEDDVFIGSDTQLVAPVRVGRGATLGAGTTLTEDAPRGPAHRLAREAGIASPDGSVRSRKK